MYKNLLRELSKSSYLCEGYFSPNVFMMMFSTIVSSLQEIKAVFHKTKAVDTKAHAADLVTETDTLVENIIMKTLGEKYPSHR